MAQNPLYQREDLQASGVGRLRGVSQAVQKAYARAGSRPMSNRDLYRHVADQLEIDFETFAPSVSAGSRRDKYSLPARTVRWVQQTLKVRGLLEKAAGERGHWQLTPRGKLRLNHVDRDQVLVAFHTRLGLALLADCRDGIATIDEPIHLCVTSPPFALSRTWGRAYGSPKLADYIDFLCAALEPVVARLADGGSIALNVSNDIFEPGSPARSLYAEYLIIALRERLGLFLMDRLIWSNPVKPPGPIAWASLERYQLNSGFEPVYWFCTNPKATFANNRRVLRPHSERHLRLIAAGGEPKAVDHSDGAHRRRAGAYGAPTSGRIPRNVLEIPHSCGDQRRYKKLARAAGLPAHGAPYPLRLAQFLIEWLSEEGHLVVDPFAGSHTTARAAETLGRRWITTEAVAEYARGGAMRFDAGDELWVNPDLDLALADRVPGYWSWYQTQMPRPTAAE